MPNLDQLADLLRAGGNPRSAEIRVISKTNDGRLVETTYRFSFGEDGDYQWSTSIRPL